jgi:hypothetical protein
MESMEHPYSPDIVPEELNPHLIQETHVIITSQFTQDTVTSCSRKRILHFGRKKTLHVETFTVK